MKHKGAMMKVNYEIMRLALMGRLAEMTGAIWNADVRETERRGRESPIVRCVGVLTIQGVPVGYVVEMDEGQFWGFEEPLKIIDYWAAEIVSMLERDRRPVAALPVVNNETAIILKWQEFIRKELEALTGQRWQVAHQKEERCGGDVRFICYWDEHNIAMPPLSFHRLANDANIETWLRERVKEVAGVRGRLL